VTISPPKFKNKYRITTSRLKEWDFPAKGWCFNTICTGARNPFFGEIEEGDVRRSTLGKIAQQCWIEIPNHFPQASSGEFVVMPKPMHGIIVIHLPEIGEGRVETQHAASLRDERGDHSLVPRDRLGSNAITTSSSGVIKKERASREKVMR
jgi:putative transposase